MKKIIIASKNPVKINATKKAFSLAFKDKFEFEGVITDSKVSSQPKSDVETLTGARNRLNSLSGMKADYFVSIEGGVEKRNKAYEVFAWIVIKNNNVEGKAKTATFELPNAIGELLDRGLELGDADDKVFNRNNSKQKNGAVGIFTNDLINRTDYYVHAIILSLIPFKNSIFYKNN